MGNSFANGLKEAQYYQQDHAREYCQSVRLYAHSHANGGDHPDRSRGGQAFGVATGVDKCAGRLIRLDVAGMVPTGRRLD
jgi:hypothetical protein